MASSPAGRPLSPVLLLGAGTGEATCGILYLASFLRRHGVEAWVRLTDDDETEEALVRSLEGLVAHVRPRLVGLSLKWFHHVARARLVARTLKALDPSLRVAVGGNTASYFWKELADWDCVDHVVLGDGEVPLLALARGDAEPPNVVTRGPDGRPRRAPLAYVQGATTEGVYYSHFPELFLSQLDLHSFSGWVAPGKGCAENCLYCSGSRGLQQATFGRAKPFLRPVAHVQRDHREVAPHTWQLRYDFSGSSADFLQRAWEGVDLSRHATTYFLWGVPPPELVEALARTFGRVFLVLDIGCFSETQRRELMGRGLLKPCPTDRELMGVIERCRRHPTLELEISGIAGLPFASAKTLEEERLLVERLVAQGSVVSHQRLQAQPGALVTEHPGRFGMATEARTFTEFLDFFEARGPAGDGTVPMLRFLDAKLEAAVQATSEHLDALAHDAAAAKEPRLTGRSRFRAAAAETKQVALSDWLGAWRVPARVAKEPVTVVRAATGAGLSLAPTLSPRRFADPLLQQGAEGAALLAALTAFRQPTTVDAAVATLRARAKLDPTSARELIAHLAAARFLQPS